MRHPPVGAREGITSSRTMRQTIFIGMRGLTHVNEVHNRYVGRRTVTLVHQSCIINMRRPFRGWMGTLDPGQESPGRRH